ncbi:hypothetical protein ACOSP7_031150 [Xanthoceras sorbifolium]
MPVLDSCKGCGFAEETVLHAVWSCSALKVVRSHWPFVKLQVPSLSLLSSFLDFFVACSTSLLPSDLCLLLVVWWRAWYRRNKLVHEQIVLPAVNVMCWSRGFLDEFSVANALPQGQGPQPCREVMYPIVLCIISPFVLINPLSLDNHFN